MSEPTTTSEQKLAGPIKHLECIPGSGRADQRLAKGEGQGEAVSKCECCEKPVLEETACFHPEDGIYLCGRCVADLMQEPAVELREALTRIAECAWVDETVEDCVKACKSIAQRALREGGSDVQPDVRCGGNGGRHDGDPGSRRGDDQASARGEGDAENGRELGGAAGPNYGGHCREIVDRYRQLPASEQRVHARRHQSPTSPQPAVPSDLSGDGEAG